MVSHRENQQFGAICLQFNEGLVLRNLQTNLETLTFMASLKRFVARPGRPLKIFSNNGKTFMEATKLMKEIQKDEQMPDYLL